MSSANEMYLIWTDEEKITASECPENYQSYPELVFDLLYLFIISYKDAPQESKLSHLMGV